MYTLSPVKTFYRPRKPSDISRKPIYIYFFVLDKNVTEKTRRGIVYGLILHWVGSDVRGSRSIYSMSCRIGIRTILMNASDTRMNRWTTVTSPFYRIICAQDTNGNPSASPLQEVAVWFRNGSLLREEPDNVFQTAFDRMLCATLLGLCLG